MVTTAALWLAYFIAAVGNPWWIYKTHEELTAHQLRIDHAFHTTGWLIFSVMTATWIYNRIADRREIRDQ